MPTSSHNCISLAALVASNRFRFAESAFDSDHPYYDPKSTREKPKWDLVHVGFLRKFNNLIRLKDLQIFAKTGGVLKNLQTLKQSRLSVSKVTKKEWDFIMSLADDGVDPEALDQGEVGHVGLNGINNEAMASKLTPDRGSSNFDDQQPADTTNGAVLEATQEDLVIEESPEREEAAVISA